jgi:tryptophanase
LLAEADRITGLKWVYEPPVLRFFTGRFEPI